MEAYNVKIDTFEGPLDLLLHLIGKMEIDIVDISVAEVTDQYVGYIRTMQKFELDVASEYLVMAATLLQLKSKQLLPPVSVEDEEVPDFSEEPTREGLIRQLIEYKAYKEAVVFMREQEEHRLELYTRPGEDLTTYMSEEVSKYDGPLNFSDLLHAYSKMIERKRWKERRKKTIKREERTLEEQMTRLHEHVSSTRQTSFFSFFVEQPNVSDLVVTFMALLELIKLRVVVTKQLDQDIQISFIESSKKGDEAVAVL
ncbi:chromosome condensation and partitioning factor [Exiguobacterium sp. 8H]|uniref:segregation/condensation protein A n=1 Tax=Exiguobacterium TaxID=33986 RepID=UPI0012EF6D90|nr:MULTISPECIES: segregation/condensation protein A [Exiguobacterium]MBG0917217.1 rifampin ADP-ribosyl transferase [Exiguobacterium sp. SRB7LM]VXB27723.1 chromosome condensation and partitioning factor [Exiguobacterium sp. 8H]VXB29099.1 chromosome condensation and partitioning factor [Exiguobacterium sp. 8A]